MNWTITHLAWLIVSLVAAATNDAQALFYEDLDITPLTESFVLTSFKFETLVNSSLNNPHISLSQHSGIPRALRQILEYTDTRELHIRFLQGRWDGEEWGEQPENGMFVGGTGVELWAWINDSTSQGTNKRWSVLTNALSGLFCASLNFVDSTKTIIPAMSFIPWGNVTLSGVEYMQLRHAALPGEPICTENLTPYLKLLPCKGKAGIAALLDGHKLSDAQWQSMSVDIFSSCTQDGCQLKLLQRIDAVVNIGRAVRRAESAMPLPPAPEKLNCLESKSVSGNSCYPIRYVAGSTWSLFDLFNREIPRACTVVHGSRADLGEVHVFVPPGRDILAPYDGLWVGDIVNFRLLDQPFDTRLETQQLVPIVIKKPPLIDVQRSMAGYGHERGGVYVTFRNPSSTSPVHLVYLESLPWFLRTFLHTLKVTVVSSNKPVDESTILQDLKYRPAIDRKRGTHLEARLWIPPSGTVKLSWEFDKAILRYTEYPPDANRGFDIAPAVITVLQNNVTGIQSEPLATFRTASLLLALPTPDFSMPYNVIILTSTVIALAFGSIFNLLVRRFVPLSEAKPTGLLERLIYMISSAFSRVRVHIEMDKDD